MTKAEVVNAIIYGLTAIGTIAVAILAVWGDAIRSWFAGPKLRILPHNLRGAVCPLSDGRMSIFYHLKVVNDRDWVSTTNCRVLLKKLWCRGPGGQFQELSLTVPLTYVWAPAEISPPQITLRREHLFDFGILVREENQFRPVLLSYTNNFQGFLKANKVIRYGLEIVSDNFVSSKLRVFEVAWNGTWSDNLDTMAQALTITDIGTEEAA